MKNIRFLDLSTTDQVTLTRCQNVFRELLDTGMWVMGKEVGIFEQRISEICSRKFAIGVGSGTDALFTMLRASGITAGDEVITPCWSWVATANAIAMTNAKPVFCDVDYDLNIDVEGLESVISKNTRAILFVNFAGKIANIEILRKISEKNSLMLFEDGSQSFGASLNNVRSGRFGIASAISHNPMKIFGGFGEAGTILTDDEALCERARTLRYSGTFDRETCILPSLNSRMDTLQAALLNIKLDTYESEIIRRQNIARYYSRELSGYLTVPSVFDSSNIFYSYVVHTSQRDKLAAFLLKYGIETKIQHKTIIPLQPAYRYLNHQPGDFPRAYKLSQEVLSLPIHGKLSDVDVEYVVETIKSFYNGA